MPALALALVATAAVIVLGIYVFRRKDDEPTPTTNDPYYSSTRTRSQSSHRPPRPSPPYNYRPSTTHTPDHGRGAYHSPYTRTPSQTQPFSTLSDELVGVEDLEFAKKLREKARRSGGEMTEAYSQAESSQRMGDRWASQEYRQQGHAHKSAMEEFDKRAAKIIFREKNKNRRDGMIDLHGLYVAEAVGFTNELLQSAGSRGDEVVRLIVGKGLHSDAGGAKIRPALENLCTERGLDHSLDPHNAGVLVVRLD
ncbi:hypothetical protein BJY52DRAFT_1115514 [Lactarius psammicola]|nr:hypothetical protein BJY52DRAFT_1115514 [Lactarius psammicola]